MKKNFLPLLVAIGLASLVNTKPASAFSFQAPPIAAIQQPLRAIDIQETAQRDLYSFQEWTRNCGMQTMEGLELTATPLTNNYQDGEDWCVYSTQSIPAGTAVIYIPASLTFGSTDIQDELGGNLEATENALTEYSNTEERLPLFRLMVKILTELENGYDSTSYAWLNAMPRRFYNGVAMTDACFDCLPPYAGWLSMKERNTFSIFLHALRDGYLELSEETLQDDNLIQWAYNVALTRHQEVEWKGEKRMAPMADMLNHATYPNAVIQYDEQGNCVVTTTQDIAVGDQLTISLGDPTNPTPLFAKYGFLYDDCPTIFCKAMNLQSEIEALGYDFSELLFYTQTGEIAPKVWDIFLYNLLLTTGDLESLQSFYFACTMGDEAIKQQYHDHYFPYTLDALKQYVNGMLQDIDTLTNKANSYDLQTHPRVPIIVAHNELVKSAFWKVQANLDTMG